MPRTNDPAVARRQALRQIAEQLASRLAPLAAECGQAIDVRSLFGGYSLGIDGLVFAAVMSDGLVMWRSDADSLAHWQAQGAEPFRYHHPNSGRVTHMPYQILPELPQSDAALADCGRLALAAARRAAADKITRQPGSRVARQPRRS